MILFLILMIALIVIATFVTFAVGIFGGIGIIIFADVIVCAILVGWIIKKLTDHNKHDKNNL